jgi:hypothetical protein
MQKVDLQGILQAFLAMLATLLLKYLGLPLSVWRLKRIHFQNLEDKVNKTAICIILIQRLGF